MDFDYSEDEVYYDGVKPFAPYSVLRLEIKLSPDKIAVAPGSGIDSKGGYSTEEGGLLYEHCRWIQVMGQLKWDHGKGGWWEVHPKTPDGVVIAKGSEQLPVIVFPRGPEDPINPFPK